MLFLRGKIRKLSWCRFTWKRMWKRCTGMLWRKGEKIKQLHRTACCTLPRQPAPPGFLTSHERFCLVLLCSQPDTVHRFPLRKTQTSSLLAGGSCNRLPDAIMLFSIGGLSKKVKGQRAHRGKESQRAAEWPASSEINSAEVPWGPTAVP